MQKSHKLSNNEVVKLLKEHLAAMEVKGANLFRIRAYQNAIAAIDNSTMSVYDLWQSDRLSDIPGVGSGLKQHLDELFKTGRVKEFEKLQKDLPQGMFSLIGLRGVGAKKAYKMAKAFELNDRKTAVDRLKSIAKKGKISKLEGFGEKSEKAVLDAITDLKTHKSVKKRMLLASAELVALRVINYLEQLDTVKKAEALGSLRRREPTVGDIDIAVATKDSKNVIDHFVKFDEVEDIISKGDKKAVVELKTGVQVDLRVIEPGLWGSMLQYNTGSKQHNVILRTYSLEKGLSLSEYGIKENGKIHKFRDEKGFYKKIGIDYIPPELRQGKNEVEKARAKKLPNLVETKDIKGDLHVHTDFSDGNDSLDTMVTAAIGKGYEYIGIADHSPSISSRGKYEVLGIVDTQRINIEQINDSQDKIKLLFGYEINILANATLSLPNEILEKLDFVIAAIHTAFDQPREQVTKRMLEAIKNPHVSIIGHPSGRLINQREGCDLDWEKVLKAAKKYNKVLEINAQPNRLDLPYELVHEAIRQEIGLIISTDAHSASSLDLMHYGIDVARRGWCEKYNIINTLPLERFLRELKR